LSMMIVFSKSFPVIRKEYIKCFLLSRKHLKLSGTVPAAPGHALNPKRYAKSDLSLSGVKK
ncbi:MAG: hypothetical protein Q8L01_03545, partial [Candidatus Woesebacteria bacterium]|nr:hypothetical protein [Candidatus Woesebacteria bacterium]